MSFYLTLIRISLVLFVLPFFGGQSVPGTVKAAFTLVLALALWPELSFPGARFPAGILEMSILLLGELILGLIMSLAVLILFSAVQFGGNLIGFQMGFTMVNVVDPLTGVSEAVTGHFLYMCTLLTFLILNGHLYMLQAFAESFRLVPPGQLLLGGAILKDVLAFSEGVFTLAVKISAPVVASLFLVDLALALVSRAAPQMHVLTLGFPVKTGVGFFFLGMIFTLMGRYVEDFVNGLVPMYQHILKALSG